MLELYRAAGHWELGFGGDTLNTAIHLARGGHAVSFMSALGTDPFSADLRARWEAEGLDCGLVLTHSNRQAGLYAISVDPDGERSFTYWRESSAARALFEIDGAEIAMQRAARADLLVFSLISLAILPDSGRANLIALAQQVRANGGRVAFDGNYRPRLWSSRQDAVAARDSAIAIADIGLPTFDDEAMLSGAASVSEVTAHWQRLGCREVVVKTGAAGCELPGGIVCPPEYGLRPVDTSGAGDAFNAGYLGARMRGTDPAEAARAGHALAGWTLMRRGAIPARDAEAPY